MNTTDPLWATMEPIHRRILEHPFVTGMTDGSLPRAAFGRYLVQDALYLADYGRALALCGARAVDTPTLRRFCLDAAEAIAAERELQDGLLDELGLDHEALSAARPTPTTRAYCDFLLRSCALEERADALGAILPCYAIYAAVGRHLAERGSPDPLYRRWIALYDGASFQAAADGANSACAAALARSDPEGRAQALAQIRQAAVYEWMFWDAAWRDERWPIPER